MRIDQSITSGIIVPDDDNVIEVYGKVSITDDVPIAFNGESISIIGKTSDAKLILKATEELQPCIGLAVQTGMSYGRWEMPSGKDLKTVTVKNCGLIMESKTEGFTVGTINLDYSPKFILEDCGTVKCPEYGHYRKLIQRVYAPSGSTKLSGSPQYAILESDEDPVPYNSEQEKAVEEAKQLGADLSLYTTDIEAVDMKSMNKFFKLGVDIHPVKRHYDVIKRHVGDFLSCLLCGVPEDDEEMLSNIKHMGHLGILAEAGVQERKWFYAYKNLFNKEPDEETNIYEELKQYAQRTFSTGDNMSEVSIEYWWELIDVFAYTRLGSHLSEVKFFILGQEV